MSARFSAAEAAAIDQERGTDDRSVWLHRAALAALRGGQDSGIPPPVILSAAVRLAGGPALAGTGFLSAEPAITEDESAATEPG